MPSTPSTFKRSALFLAAALCIQSANAGFMPVFVNTTPLGGGQTQFNYTLNFSTLAPGGVAPRLDPGQFLTIYDIPGFVSATSPGFPFGVAAANLGLTAPLTAPSDDPGLVNVTFVYLGPPVSVDTVFAGLTIVSTFGFVGLDNYTSTFMNVSNSTTSSEIGFVAVPSTTQTPGPGVPDGGSTAILLGVALTGLVAIRRRVA